MTSKFLLILGIGHVLGDFYFQTDKMAQQKDKSWKGIVKHAIEYAASVLLIFLLFINMNLMKWILLYSASHLIIDAVKYKLLRTGKIKKSAKLFIIDQCAHIICIFVIAYMMEISSCTLSHYYLIDSIQQVFGFSKEKVARWILAILIIHEPANILIQSILKELKDEDTVDSGTKGIAPSDMKAGRKIGSIERLIMLLFIAMNQYTAMGMVLTAKSIARYDQITREQTFAEYYLIGTLLSTASVVICKVILLWHENDTLKNTFKIEPEHSEEIQNMVDAGKYFTINRARQYGKTTTIDAEKQISEYFEYFGLSTGYMLSFNFNKKKETGVKQVHVGGKVLYEGVV